MPSATLARISTSDLRREIERRAAQASMLELKRTEIARELERLDAELEVLAGDAPAHGGAAPEIRSTRAASRRGRPTRASITRTTNKEPLHAVLRKILNGTTMGVSELAGAAQRAGYKSNATNFDTIVNLTLLKRKDLFKRVGRGQYTVK